MVDDAMYGRYVQNAEKSLQRLDKSISGMPQSSMRSIFDLDDDDFVDPSAPPAYQAMRYAVRQARRNEDRARSQANGTPAIQEKLFSS